MEWNGDGLHRNNALMVRLRRQFFCSGSTKKKKA
jgi:hypothetical protein